MVKKYFIAMLSGITILEANDKDIYILSQTKKEK